MHMHCPLQGPSDTPHRLPLARAQSASPIVAAMLPVWRQDLVPPMRPLIVRHRTRSAQSPRLVQCDSADEESLPCPVCACRVPTRSWRRHLCTDAHGDWLAYLSYWPPHMWPHRHGPRGPASQRPGLGGRRDPLARRRTSSPLQCAPPPRSRSASAPPWSRSSATLPAEMPPLRPSSLTQAVPV